MSQCRACETRGVDRTTVSYVSRRSDDAKARTRIRELAGQRRRFGYRRLHWLLCREGCGGRCPFCKVRGNAPGACSVAATCRGVATPLLRGK